MKTKPIHFNASHYPDKNRLPACQLGGNWGRDFSKWVVTIDKAKITCAKRKMVMSK